MFLFSFLYICYHRMVKHLIQYFFKSSILVQIALYFSNNFISNFFQFQISYTYPLILGILKTNGLIVLSNFIPSTYLELVFVSTNFEKTMLSTLTSQFFKGFFAFFFFKSHHYYTMEKNL